MDAINAARQKGRPGMSTTGTTAEGLPTWLSPNRVEAVILRAPADSSWLLRAYLIKHEGRFIRYRSRAERQTDFTSPATPYIKAWAYDAIQLAKIKAWDTDDGGYWETMNRIAYDYLLEEDYPPCEILEGYWKFLA